MNALFKRAHLPYALFLGGILLIFLWARSRKYEGFENAPTGGYKFAMYYADWCPHCHAAKPEFDKLGSRQTIGGHKVEIEAIEEKQIPEAVKSSVSGYPTVRLLDAQGQIVDEYSGERTHSAFQAYLTKKLGK